MGQFSAQIPPGQSWTQINTHTLEYFINEVKPTIAFALNQHEGVGFDLKTLRVTGIDFSLDVINLHSHHFVVSGKSEAIKNYSNHIHEGVVQSHYLGSDKSVNEFIIYDRSARLSKSYPGVILPQTTRLEHAYRPTGGAYFDQLYKVHPFKNLAFSYFPAGFHLPPDIEKGDFKNLIEAVQKNGLPIVLDRYDDLKKRKRLKALLVSRPPSWWPPQPDEFHPALDKLKEILTS